MNFEMSEVDLQLVMTCVSPGCSVTPFAQPPPSIEQVSARYHVLMFALYPPSKANEKYCESNNSMIRCQTEKDLRQIWDLLIPNNVPYSLNWTDLFPISSDTNNKAILQENMLPLLALDGNEANSLMTSFFERFKSSVKNSTTANYTPICYVCGKICQQAFNFFLKIGSIRHERSLSEIFDIGLYFIGGYYFIALVNAPHPSYRRTSRNAPLAKDSCIQAAKTVGGMLQCVLKAAGNVNIESLTDMTLCCMKSTNMTQEEIDMINGGRQWLTNILYGEDYQLQGYFPEKQMHLRNVQAHKFEVQTVIRKWKDISILVLNTILMNGELYLDLPAYDNVLMVWFNRLGPDGFVTFMCDGVAARLVDPAFDERLWMEWFHRLGPDGFVTFMCDGVAARLVDPAFDARLMVWFHILGPDGFVTFIHVRWSSCKTCRPRF